MLVYAVLFALTDSCIDIETLETVNPDAVKEYKTYENKDISVSWWKAGISEYSMTDDMIYEDIVKPVMEMPETESVQLSEAEGTKGYASEVFTVYDLNSGTYVTANGMDLVLQIVRNEIGAHYTSGSKYGQTVYAKEAIKAYAVAAYSHIKYCSLKGQIAEVGLRSDYSETMKSYVEEVDGLGVYYNGKIICAMYCASTGGYTISSSNALGTDLPYLSSVESKYDNQGRQYVSEVSLTSDELKKVIEAKTDIVLSDNPENWIKIENFVDGNYVGQMVIDGNTSCNIRGKQYSLTGSNFKLQIMNKYLKSPAFTVSYSDGVFTFTSYGYGHGLGLPADGANLYAINEGWSYIQILTHYYQGTEIKKL